MVEESSNNTPELLSVKLFFVEKPIVDDKEILDSLRKRFAKVRLAPIGETAGTSRHYFFEDYEVEYEEGKISAQGTLYIPDGVKIQFDKLVTSFRQSWNWKEAEDVVRSCRYEILLTDLMSRGLDYKMRLEYFQKFVTGIVETMNPSAICLTNTQKIMNKDEYLRGFTNGNFQHLNSFLNVRLFNVEKSEKELIMDTLGLSSLGLPDFEIRFQNYDPSLIANCLLSYGNYIFENGVVIESGNTVEGIEESQKWKCYFRDSVVDPKRIVINIANESS